VAPKPPKVVLSIAVGLAMTPVAAAVAGMSLMLAFPAIIFASRLAYSCIPRVAEAAVSLHRFCPG